jgi:hypothetical protein
MMLSLLIVVVQARGLILTVIGAGSATGLLWEILRG